MINAIVVGTITILIIFIAFIASTNLGKNSVMIIGNIIKLQIAKRIENKEDLFNRENRNSLMTVVNKKTVFILLPITLPTLIYLSKKIAKRSKLGLKSSLADKIRETESPTSKHLTPKYKASSS